MKKLLYFLPIIVLAAGCKSSGQSQSGSQQRPPVSQTNSQLPSPGINSQKPSEAKNPRSLDQLVQAYKKAHAAKDVNAILALFYTEGVDEKTKATLVKSLNNDFPLEIESMEIVEPSKNNIYEYTQGGIQYKVNLPVIKEFKIHYKQNTTGQTYTSYYVGEKNGSYYLVTATLVSQ